MPVFASQFGRARPYAVAYAGPPAENRFWVPATVTAASIGAAAVLAATVDEVLDRVDAADPVGGFDPDTLDHATLELPGLAIGHLGTLQPAAHTPADPGDGSGVDTAAQSGAAAGTGDTVGVHTGTLSGGAAGADSAAADADAASATDLVSHQSALLDGESAGAAWAYQTDLAQLDAGGLSSINTGDSGVTIGPDDGAAAG